MIKVQARPTGRARSRGPPRPSARRPMGRAHVGAPTKSLRQKKEQPICRARSRRRRFDLRRPSPFLAFTVPRLTCRREARLRVRLRTSERRKRLRCRKRLTRRLRWGPVVASPQIRRLSRGHVLTRLEIPQRQPSRRWATRIGSRLRCRRLDRHRNANQRQQRHRTSGWRRRETLAGTPRGSLA
jgi:hypothetical protein